MTLVFHPSWILVDGSLWGEFNGMAMMSQNVPKVAKPARFGAQILQSKCPLDQGPLGRMDFDFDGFFLLPAGYFVVVDNLSKWNILGWWATVMRPSNVGGFTMWNKETLPKSNLLVTMKGR